MLEEEFEIWLVDLLLNTILVIVGMHIINQSFLEDRSSYFTELLDSNTKELNKMLVELDIATVILEINYQDLSNLIDLKVKQANKKKEKAEKC